MVTGTFWKAILPNYQLIIPIILDINCQTAQNAQIHLTHFNDWSTFEILMNEEKLSPIDVSSTVNIDSAIENLTLTITSNIQKCTCLYTPVENPNPFTWHILLKIK